MPSPLLHKGGEAGTVGVVPGNEFKGRPGVLPLLDLLRLVGCLRHACQRWRYGGVGSVGSVGRVGGASSCGAGSAVAACGGSVVRVGGGAVVWVLIENARTKYF